MTNIELFKECVSRLNQYGISMIGTCVYSHNGEKLEFNAEGFNFGFNLARLGRVLDYEADFS